jgi:hypothetical protein
VILTSRNEKVLKQKRANLFQKIRYSRIANGFVRNSLCFSDVLGLKTTVLSTILLALGMTGCVTTFEGVCAQRILGTNESGILFSKVQCAHD